MRKRKKKFNDAIIFGTLCEGAPKIDRGMNRKLASKVCDAVLLPFQVDRKHLKNVLLCMQLMDVMGLTVQGGLRQDIVKHLPLIDDAAKRANSVDTIVKSNKTLKGYNSMALACLDWLDEHGVGKLSEVIVAGKSDLMGQIAGALRTKGAKLTRLRSRTRIAELTIKRIPSTIIIGNMDATSAKRLFSVIKKASNKPPIIDLRDPSKSTRTGPRAPCLKMPALQKKSHEISVELLTCAIKR